MVNTVHNIIDEKSIDDSKQNDGVEKLIGEAIKNQSFDLSCLNRNDNVPCPQMFRLAKLLVKHKRWVHTVYKKTNGEDNIDKTIQINHNVIRKIELDAKEFGEKK
eukprot:132374_1